MSGAPPRPGEVILEHASRAFAVRADQARTLKELVLGQRRGGPQPVQALDDVSLRIAPGETVGIVGRNGAGKTSTLKVLAGIVPLNSGRVDCGGRVVALLELGAGFGRDFTGRENIHLGASLYGLSKADIEARVDRIIAFAELGEFIDVPVRTYSSGMYVRLGFAIAAHLDPDVLLLDEVLAVGDEAFQRKCLRRIQEQIAQGTTLLLVSHDPGAIERVCARVVVIDGGKLVFDGPTADGLLHYHRLMGTEAGPERIREVDRARPLAVDDAQLQDSDGRPAGVFRSGDELAVTVSVLARERLERPRLALEVRDENGARVFATESALTLVEGRARVRFAIPRLALLGGDYDLALAAADGEHDGGWDRVLKFAVVREPGAEGIVDLRGEWSALAATEEEAVRP